MAKPEHVWLPVTGVIRYFDAKSGGSMGIDPSSIASLTKLVRAPKGATKRR